MAGPFGIAGAFRTTLTQTDTTAQEELGVLRLDSGRILKYVKANATTVNGNAMKYTGTTGTLVTPTTASIDPLAGICETSIAANSFGWMTVYGPASASVDSANTAAGVALSASGTSGLLNRYIASIAPGPVGGYAVALEAGAFSPSRSTVFVQCL